LRREWTSKRREWPPPIAWRREQPPPITWRREQPFKGREWPPKRREWHVGGVNSFLLEARGVISFPNGVNGLFLE